MNNTIYKIIIVLLLILSLILGIFLYQEKNKVANESLSDSISLVEECNIQLATWRETNGDSVDEASDEAKAELETILAKCSGSFE